jgi:transcription termination/antitermination protein NusA
MLNLVNVFTDFKSGKNIDLPTMVRVMEDVFRTLIKKKYGSDENFDVIVNTSTGDLEIWRLREIVQDGEVTDERSQVSLSEAQTIDESVNLGEECYEQIHITDDFGRRAIMAARQTLVSRIMELEKDEIFRKYSERVGDVITGEVSQIMKKEILVVDDETKNEIVLPRTEMIKGDFYRKGDVVKGIVRKVEMRNNVPYIMLSRTDTAFLHKLLEAEVPEIEDGIIEIKNIVRLPGDRAKVAVESHDERIDPVGACVGVKGSRIHGIVRELRNENIDIINYTTNLPLFIQRSLTPAKISNIEIDQENKRVSVYLDADQVSLAIGKAGSNIKLATKLTGFEIDVYRNQAEYEIDDVDLEEFSDVIEPWVIEAFKNIGCDTARQVLELSVEELVRRTDLEEETVRELVNILASEFEEN